MTNSDAAAPFKQRLAARGYQKLQDVTVGYGTTILETLSGLSIRDCWEACVEADACESALYLRGTRPNTCQLLDSVAEHRLITLPRRSRGALLYSVNRREMELPPIGWNDTQTGAGTCELRFDIDGGNMYHLA